MTPHMLRNGQQARPCRYLPKRRLDFIPQCPVGQKAHSARQIYDVPNLYLNRRPPFLAAKFRVFLLINKWLGLT